MTGPDGEKALIKEGKSASQIWPEAPAKAAQKDIDARWTMKRGSLKQSEAGAPSAPPAQIMVPMFGYKNHAGIDRTFGFVVNDTVKIPTIGKVKFLTFALARFHVV